MTRSESCFDGGVLQVLLHALRRWSREVRRRAASGLPSHSRGRSASSAATPSTRSELPHEGVLSSLPCLCVRDACVCDVVSREWRAACALVFSDPWWRARFEALRGDVPRGHPKSVYLQAVKVARRGLNFRTGDTHVFNVSRSLEYIARVGPVKDQPWLAFVGAPTTGRRFVAINVFFAWSWCCRIGVMESQHDSVTVQTVAEIMDQSPWFVTARPPSRFEEDKLVIEGRDDVQADADIFPCHGSFVHHLAGGRRMATLGILMDFGRVTFFVRSSNGEWASTGVIAESAAPLVPFVRHPLQDAELLDIVEPPAILAASRDDLIALLRARTV